MNCVFRFIALVILNVFSFAVFPQKLTYINSNNCIIPSSEVYNTDSIDLGCFTFLGIKISNFYLIKDSLKLKLNNDSKIDYYLIISPITQEYGEDTVHVTPHLAKRLLILLVSENNKYNISFINENIIPNNYDYQSDPYMGITLNEWEGINLSVSTGSSVKCHYKYFFKKNNKGTYLAKSNMNCYLINLTDSYEKERLYKFKKNRRIETIILDNYLYKPKIGY